MQISDAFQIGHFGVHIIHRTIVIDGIIHLGIQCIDGTVDVQHPALTAATGFGRIKSVWKGIVCLVGGSLQDLFQDLSHISGKSIHIPAAGGDTGIVAFLLLNPIKSRYGDLLRNGDIVFR